MNHSAVRTRFAPSPTGYLHIGGVRTALFNWLFARKHGGQFILRIDDTDQQRNVAEALAPILDGFRWLGIDWDEGADAGGPCGPYYQSQKTERYQAAVRTLVERGLAYHDYATTEELKAEREAAEKEKRPFLYSRRWLAETAADRARFEAEGRKGVVRLKMPRDGQCRFHDHIRGDMVIDWASEQDHVVQRADGSCLYNLASVVDDFDMKISHVIRAEEHLSNTARQVFVAQGLGYPLPEYAHVPFVAEPGSKNKLSKRKIAQYLRNPDFKKVYEAGYSICERQSIKDALKLASLIRKSLEPHPVLIEAVSYLAQLLGEWVISQGLKLTSNQVEQFKGAAFIDEIRRGLENPGYLASYEYGEKILKRYSEPRPAETFNPVIVDFYREVGYLPDAIINYLVLLGWSLDDKTEFFTRQQMIELFSLERVNKGASSFDPKKLFAFQDRYMQQLPVADKTARCLPFLEKAKFVTSPPSPPEKARVEQIVQAAGDRIKVAGDVLDYAFFFIADDELLYDEPAFDKRIRKPAEAIGLLSEFKAALADVEPFDAPTLEKSVNGFVQTKGIRIDQIIHALRVAVTGKPIGFGVFETLAILGRESCLNRIDRALAHARQA
jgi:glutamyl/glutaminyl-tRNA synthetase